MCRYRSGVAVRRDETEVTLFLLEGEDSHQTIRDHYKLRDRGGMETENQVSMEYLPGTRLDDLDGYTLVFDSPKPAWWNAQHTESATHQFRREIAALVASKTWRFAENCDLSSVTSLPEGVTLSAGGDLNLSSLTSIPEGVTLSAGGSLYLSSLTSIPEGVTLSAGGSLYLRSLTSLPEGVKVDVRGKVFLRGDR